MGRAFILLITKDIERKAIIRKAKKTIPNDLKLDFEKRSDILFYILHKNYLIEEPLRHY